MTKKLLLPVAALIMALGLVSLSLAQGEGKDTVITGVFVDDHCKDKASAPGDHSVGCIVAGPCGKSGLGVYSDGKFTKFDAKGSEEAIAALKKSNNAATKFKVTGVLSGETLTVKKIEEAK